MLSYFEAYFNLRREKTLRRYSRPIHLACFDRIDWMTSAKDLWEIPRYLVDAPHRRLLTPKQERALSQVDRRMFTAGLVGKEMS
jgi:hypothetical protein